MTTATVTIAPVRKSILVKATPERAFDVFARSFDTWWPRSHHIGKSDMKAGIMEPRPGGRWYEIGEDGVECDWGQVIAWEPPDRLVLAWHLNGSFQYNPDIASEVEIRFIAEGDATRVELEHRNLEALGQEDGERARAAVDSPNGWSTLLELFAARVAS
jgi:uncharacterized protein YndB with AHSA1/START domain